ncbi:valyl-tRNA synthetase [Nematocida sp. AWRm80]|nr:valyl-tRNA synthetase [Nematocida sp. AWRm80]
MDELKRALEAETDERKKSKIEKKIAKLSKFLSKVKIEPTEKKNKKKIEFTEAIEIPEGEKKTVTGLEGQFNPLAVENGWFSWWEAQKFFMPETRTKKTNGKTFTMVLPPPNVTGSLHIGHAMMASIQDTIVRMKRMQGYKTLYLPGTDHAGIATQVVVEKSLSKQNITRQSLGRDQFLEKVWEWKNAYGNEITRQFRKLGSSLDFTREKFTMDEQLSSAVTDAFIEFHRQGLIYRGKRIVNWCAKIQTTLSDLEVNYTQVTPFQKIQTDGGSYVFGRLFVVKYTIEKDGNVIGELNVSTTRPETIYGDVALCAHPEDSRYTQYKDATPINPLTNAKMRFVFDESVEMDFGTGLLKVTPAHDPVDFAIGERHSLEGIMVLDKNNNMTMGEYKGLNRFEAREKTAELLKEKGVLVSVEGHSGSVPLCSRTGEVVESILLPQWWMKCKDLAQKALEASETGELEIYPEEMKKTWNTWLSNIRDWCLSRQLWWGHRIPAYTANGEWYIAKTQQEAEKMAGCPVVQEEDVLDTWFSSGLWPFATLGWPENSQDMKDFYPTTLLETGKDIVFFWVARMVMMGISLTGKLPFKQVLFHSIVRDAKGEKMSKSKGNVIDPVDVITGTTLDKLLAKLKSGNLSKEEIKLASQNLSQEYKQGIEACGSDALRFALLSSASLGKDVNLSIDKVSSCRRFCNKIWNAMKFTMLQSSAPDTPTSEFHEKTDLWIQTKLVKLIHTVTQAIDSYNFMKAATEAQQFLVYEFCDFYLEFYKGRKDSQGLNILRKVSLTYILLLHPLLPFLTEQIYQAMKHQWSSLSYEWMESITIDEYPTNSLRFSEEDEALIDDLLESIKGIRSIIQSTELETCKTVKIQMSQNTGTLSMAIPEISKLLGVEVLLVSSLKEGVSLNNLLVSIE